MYWLDNKIEPTHGFGEVLDKSKVSLSISSTSLEDEPLVGVNSAFCTLTGYTAEQVLGRNCRFLQPVGGAGPVRNRIREYLADESSTADKFLMSNVKADGTPFLNLVFLSKLNLNGKTSFVLGSQFELAQHGLEGLGTYETALKEDIRDLRVVGGEMGTVMLGTFEQLATSHAIIAEQRLADFGGMA